MIIRSAMIAATALLALSGSIAASTASAEDPKDKSLTEQAREQSAARLRELQEAERTARQKLRDAEQQVKEAEQQLKSAAANAKQAAEKAVSDAKRALQAAKLEASAAGTRTLQAIRALQKEGKQSLDATLETAHAKAHAATDEVAGKAAELKADVAEVAAQARDEAEGAAAQAGETVRHMKGMVHQIARDAVGATGENVLRKQARRSAFRRLAGRVERPRDVPPSVREELRRHAQRIARLRRIRFVATEQNDRESVTRVDALVARENARHEGRLPQLWDAAGKRLKGAEDEEQEPADEAAEDEEEQP
jgi:hypothetical protein